MKFSAAVLAFASSASAHMILHYPVPYGNPNSSPLEASGSDYPCKATGPGDYTVTTPNEWNAGETKEVSFQGSATHGGGSCQFSITTDTAPTKDTQFKVIHSVIGNCPSSAEGNLGNDPDSLGATKYPVTLPADLPDGEYTFAWSWLNKIGNREFYMNCAPITVGGGSKKSKRDVQSVLGDLPDMFVANIGGTCTTKEGEDFDYPNPGQSVETGTVSVNIAADFSDDSGCASVTAMGAGNGQLGSPAKATGAPASEAPASTQAPVATSAAAPVASAVPSNPGGVFAPGASSAPAATAPAATSAAAAQPTGNPSNSTPANGEGVACDTDGAVVCIGSSQFGLCNQGMAVPMDLAAGTTCSGGVISKRSVKFPRAHLHRRHGSGLL